MKLAVMQPYFFPYLGYFELVARVDKFVFIDDVSYQRGWMNRNRFLIGGQPKYLTIPLVKASQNRRLDQTRVMPEPEWREKMLHTVELSYKRAPFFKPVFQIFEDVLQTKSNYLADVSKASVTRVAKYLSLTADFVYTSRIYANSHLKGEDRILDIAVVEQALEYHNLPGGRSLYSPASFAKAGIQLSFVDPKLEPYSQPTPVFHPGLSIIDVLMFTPPETVNAWLEHSKPKRNALRRAA